MASHAGSEAADPRLTSCTRGQSALTEVGLKYVVLVDKPSSY